MGYSNKTWACPFFKWDERRRVHCEGGRMEFRDMEHRRRYIEEFCACVAGWGSCTVARATLAYYERMEGIP